MNLAHRILLDPTPAQWIAFARAAGCARFSYNWALDWWNREHLAGRKPSANKAKVAFNKIKEAAFPWIYDSPKDANQQPFTDLGAAFSAFFSSIKGNRKGRKMGRPQFKKKGRSHDSFYVSNDKFDFSEDGWSVRLPVIGVVKLREQLRFAGKILSGRVSRTADDWFLSVAVDGEFRVPNTPSRSLVGVDLGIKTAVVLSSGQTFEAPKPLRTNLASKRRLARKMARQQKGSNNRLKTKRRAARLDQRITNVRKDFWHKVTTSIARENQAVVIEDLNVLGMAKLRSLARAVRDVAIGMFRPLLTYKAERFGCEVIVASRWYASSKICSECDAVKAEMPLSERVYRCEHCGMVKDRDKNAADNLEKYPGLPGNVTPGEIQPLPSKIKSRASRVVEPGSLKRSLVIT